MSSNYLMVEAGLWGTGKRAYVRRPLFHRTTYLYMPLVAWFKEKIPLKDIAEVDSLVEGATRQVGSSKYAARGLLLGMVIGMLGGLIGMLIGALMGLTLGLEWKSKKPVYTVKVTLRDKRSALLSGVKEDITMLSSAAVCNNFNKDLQYVGVADVIVRSTK